MAQAYTSIAAEDFAAFVGYSVEEAVKGNVISAFFSQPVILLSILITLIYTELLRIFFFSPPHFKGVVSQGWQADANTRMVMPKKPGRWQCCSVKLQPGGTQKEPSIQLPSVSSTGILLDT